jgi:hypothetical protein
MKTLIPLTALAALVATGSLSAQTPAFSKPSGYETISLQPGFNFVGMRLVESAVTSGTFTSNTTTALTDSSATFALNATTLYLVEFGGNDPVKGMILEALGSSFSGGTLSGLSGITADYLTTYTIRPAKTLGQVFGTGSNVLISKGTAATGDTVIIPNAQGGFNTFFHSADLVVGPTTFPGSWQQVGSSGNKSTTPINYLDGFYVQIRGAAKDLVVSGQVKTSATLLPAIQGFSYFSSIYPAGTTLGSSGLASVITKGTAATGDTILLPNGSGGFNTFFHSADLVVGPTTFPGSWQQVGSSGNKSATPITTGFIFQRRGASANLPFTPPTFYSGL